MNSAWRNGIKYSFRWASGEITEKCHLSSLMKCFRRVRMFTWIVGLCAISSSSMCSRTTLRLLTREVAAIKSFCRVKVFSSLSFRSNRVRGESRVKIAGTPPTVGDRVRSRVMCSSSTIKASRLKRKKASLRRRKNGLPHLTMLLIWQQILSTQ